MRRWAVRVHHPDGDRTLLPTRYDTREDGLAALRAHRRRQPACRKPWTAFRLVRVTTRSERLAAELDALARDVGQALVVPTLEEGEELSEPSGHAIVGAMLRMREQRDAARAAADRLDRSLTHVRLALDAAGVRDTEPAPPLPPVMDVERVLSQGARVVLLTRERDGLRRQLDEARAGEHASEQEAEAMRDSIEQLTAELAKPEDQRLREALEAMGERAPPYLWIARAGSAERTVEDQECASHEQCQKALLRAERERDKARAACDGSGSELARTRHERDQASARVHRDIVDALLRCTRNDLPPGVDEMVRERMLSGGDALTTAAAVRETAAILATWIERGCP